MGWRNCERRRRHLDEIALLEKARLITFSDY